MFFRIYIFSILSCFLLLLTPLWGVSYVILFWLLIILIRMHFYYKKWKKQQATHYSKTLSFCIKSLKRQKQNFRIINLLLKEEALKNYFKRLSIVLDDINVKIISNYDDGIYLSHTHEVIKNDHRYNPSYSGYSFNIHNKSNNDH